MTKQYKDSEINEAIIDFCMDMSKHDLAEIYLESMPDKERKKFGKLLLEE